MLSRRDFLTLCGITAAGGPLLGGWLREQLSGTSILGRPFATTAVHAAADPASPVIMQLWADHPVTITHSHGDWLRVTQGYVKRQTLQVIEPHYPGPPLQTPDWIEVAAPYSVTRQWADPAAPVLARWGHGAVLYAVDRLEDWFQVIDALGQPRGWTQAVCWRQAQTEDQRHPEHGIKIRLHDQTLTAYDGSQDVLHIPVAANPVIQPGLYTVTRQTAGGAQGAGWLQTFGPGWELGGVYWHNAFGTPVPGMAVQLPTIGARWLYGWLTVGSRIIVET